MTTQTDKNPWVIRCDYSDDRLWEIVKTQIATPRTDPLSGMEFTANIRFEEDSSFRNLSYLEIVRRLPDDYPGFVLFLVDAKSISRHPIDDSIDRKQFVDCKYGLRRFLKLRR